MNEFRPIRSFCCPICKGMRWGSRWNKEDESFTRQCSGHIDAEGRIPCEFTWEEKDDDAFLKPTGDYIPIWLGIGAHP